MIEFFDREAFGIKCPKCKVGYAERVDCTEKELKQFNCGRSYECCARAFVCLACGQRSTGRALAPEME